MMVGGIKYSGSWPGMKIIPERAITHAAFRDRLGLDVCIELELAAAHDPAAGEYERFVSAMLRAYIKRAEAAEYIDLELPLVREGLEQLEAAALLEQGGADAIIEPEVTDAERYTR